MATPLNFRHLYYFWVVAKEGGMSRGADRLGMAVQTVSAQVRALEQELGHALFKPSGRALVLTEGGEAAMALAEQIFQLGEALPAAVREAATGVGMRLRVGISDGLPKLVVRHLLRPAVADTGARLLCHEDEFDRLLAELALHKLDALLADRAAPTNNPNLRLYSHKLGEAPLAWFAPAALIDKLGGKRRARFPACLAHMPVLLPTGHAAVRPRLDAWFERRSVRPLVVGEFEDSALLVTFAAGGMGVFPAPVVAHDKLVERYDLHRFADGDGVEEQFYAIATERKVLHPLVQRLLPQPG